MRCAGASCAIRAKTGRRPWRGQILRYADRIAYINADIDDAIRGEIIYPMDIPLYLKQLLGFTYSQRINTLTCDVIAASEGQDQIRQTPEIAEAMEELRQFMFEYVYRNPRAKGRRARPRICSCAYLSTMTATPTSCRRSSRRSGRKRAKSGRWPTISPV